ncbi:fibrobacter succinogenes major paralogous domain-containing protein [Litoribacter alkaliphilus]|uniref:Fibrobacter succinogenes major paralogous domain-containing protein n=1 Tax=Litoribacter ruber TaxID=702568 RepID=A0AAP2CIB3_9BACT|nr:fibrobacter succinogenes major paralogous domain-containing protein [Litoribacter alkaliphilus]MBS9525268.1 fibrobacter succinogenes major paralogous domain-containing protein [Litoribacter alkaliphilus]
MKRGLTIITFLFLIGCNSFEEFHPTGMVLFTGFSKPKLQNPTKNAKLESTAWTHIFQDEVQLTIINQQDGSELQLQFDPNDFRQPYEIDLPYGEYNYNTELVGGDFEDYLPFEVNGQFDVNNANNEIVLEGVSNYSVITFEAQLLDSVSITIGNLTKALPKTKDGKFYYQYIREGQNILIHVQEKFDGKIFSKSLDIDALKHYHFVLEVSTEGNLNIINIVLSEFDFEEEVLDTSIINNIVVDIEGNVYKVIKIGNQIWMGENLRSSTFCNGDKLEEIGMPTEEWFTGITIPASWSIDNDDTYDYPYGKLYNNAAAEDERNICPCDWEIPNDDDWNELISYLGGNEVAGHKLRSTKENYWREQNYFLATNESGFDALPTGYIIYSGHESYLANHPWYYFGSETMFYSSSQSESEYLIYNPLGRFTLNSEIWGYGRDNQYFISASSIRCIKKN